MSTNSTHFTHPTAVIDDGAIIGEGTKIWYFSHVFSGARIGKNCVIGQGCSIASKVVIGDRCKLQNGISVYDCVILEDDVFCGPHMIFTNVINPRAFVERKSEYKTTRVCCGASIGAGAIIVCGNPVGCYAFVGAGAVVTHEVPPFALVFGNPARQHGWVGKCGNKLTFDEHGRTTGEDGTVYVLRDGEVREE